MSKWTHNICEMCWAIKEPDREPVRVLDAETTKCCFCGEQNNDGIYVREAPENVRCGGQHED